MKRFFIKRTYKNTEEFYWQGKKSMEFPLTKERVITEFIALSFYRILGIATPKTYIGEARGNAVLISKQMKEWHALRYDESFENPIPILPTDLQTLAELELASAVLADIDVTGWCLDNIGYKMRSDLLRHVTKHDGGTAIINKKRKQFFMDFFKEELDNFPEGIATITDDTSLNTTYLKVFKEKSACAYQRRYSYIFDGVSAIERKKSLLKLFKIDREILFDIMNKIPDSWYSPSEKDSCVEFLLQRIQVFREKFAINFKEEELYPIEKLELSYFFNKLKKQKNLVKQRWEEKYILDEEYQPTYQDSSQSGAGKFRYKK